MDLASSWEDLDYSPGTLSLAESVCSHLGVDLGLSGFTGDVSTEIKEVESLEFGVVVDVSTVNLISACAESKFIIFLGILSHVSGQIVLEIWILFDTMEQLDLHLLFIGK